MPAKGTKVKHCRKGHVMKYCGKEINGRWRCYECYKITSRAMRLRNCYGLTIQEADSLIVKQKDKCAICKQKNSSNRRLHIDHNHNTGKIRELLCSHCNQGLGHFKDNIASLTQAIKYLEKHK